MRLKLYIADRRKNQMMAAFDLCPPYKVFVSVISQDVERQGSDSDIDFIWRIIKQSRAEKYFWIPAVGYNGLIYAVDGIKEISDGKSIIFISTPERKSK